MKLDDEAWKKVLHELWEAPGLTFNVAEQKVELLRPYFELYEDLKVQMAISAFGYVPDLWTKVQFANAVYYLAITREATLDCDFEVRDTFMNYFYGLRNSAVLTLEQAKRLWIARLATIAYFEKYGGTGLFEWSILDYSDQDLAHLLAFRILPWTTKTARVYSQEPEGTDCKEQGSKTGHLVLYSAELFFPNSFGLGWFAFEADDPPGADMVTIGKFWPSKSFGIMDDWVENPFGGVKPVLGPHGQDGHYWTYSRLEEISESSNKDYVCCAHIHQWNPIADMFKVARIFSNIGFENEPWEQAVVVLNWLSDAFTRHNVTNEEKYYWEWMDPASRLPCIVGDGGEGPFTFDAGALSVSSLLSLFDDQGDPSPDRAIFDHVLLSGITNQAGKLMSSPMKLSFRGCHFGTGLMMHWIAALNIPASWFSWSYSPGSVAWSPSLGTSHCGVRVLDRFLPHTDSVFKPGGFSPEDHFVPKKAIEDYCDQEGIPGGTLVQKYAAICGQADDWSAYANFMRFLYWYRFYGAGFLATPNLANDEVLDEAMRYWCCENNRVGLTGHGPWGKHLVIEPAKAHPYAENWDYVDDWLMQMVVITLWFLKSRWCKLSDLCTSADMDDEACQIWRCGASDSGECDDELDQCGQVIVGLCEPLKPSVVCLPSGICAEAGISEECLQLEACVGGDQMDPFCGLDMLWQIITCPDIETNFDVMRDEYENKEFGQAPFQGPFIISIHTPVGDAPSLSVTNLSKLKNLGFYPDEEDFPRWVYLYVRLGHGTYPKEKFSGLKEWVLAVRTETVNGDSIPTAELLVAGYQEIMADLDELSEDQFNEKFGAKHVQYWVKNVKKTTVDGVDYFHYLTFD